MSLKGSDLSIMITGQVVTGVELHTCAGLAGFGMAPFWRALLNS